MSAPADTAPPSDVPAPAGRSVPLALILAVVAGLGIGAGAGLFAVGPALAKGIAPAVAANAARAKHAPHADDAAADDANADDASADDAATEDESDAKAEHGKDGGAAGLPVYTLDNLVLNPAESGGTRFLLLTISFELKNQETHDAMKARDAELRDMILATLGHKTVEQLSDVGARDSLKIELKSAAAKLLKRPLVRRVYFPQFVIQ
jgi:flagellar FliL protein